MKLNWKILLGLLLISFCSYFYINDSVSMATSVVPGWHASIHIPYKNFTLAFLSVIGLASLIAGIRDSRK